jgi:hypothetical protein
MVFLLVAVEKSPISDEERNLPIPNLFKCISTPGSELFTVGCLSSGTAAPPKINNPLYNVSPPPTFAYQPPSRPPGNTNCDSLVL